MNDTVRAAVKARLDQQNMSRADLARAVGKTPQEISRALNAGHGGGEISRLWVAILEALDLHLTVEPGQVECVTAPTKVKSGRKPARAKAVSGANHDR